VRENERQIIYGPSTFRGEISAERKRMESVNYVEILKVR
jgi:hypothetical protein